ncbi:MAG: hypothetical protein ACPGWR_08605 [Ardenticatenaceae bacterium]
MTKRVFDIVQVEQESDDTWLVSGRALEDIEAGDVVSVNRQSKNGATYPNFSANAAFTVVSISTYGHETPILDRMWTGTLTLQGVYHQGLKEGQFLSRVHLPVREFETPSGTSLPALPFSVARAKTPAF